MLIFRKEVEVLKVPEGMCPMDFLADLGDRIKDAWLFLSKSIREDLQERADEVNCKECSFTKWLTWRKTQEYPETKMYFHDTGSQWAEVKRIKASDIAFTVPVSDPKKIIFIISAKDKLITA